MTKGSVQSRGKDGIKTGALKHGHYYWSDEYVDQFISPLYRAHIESQ